MPTPSQLTAPLAATPKTTVTPIRGLRRTRMVAMLALSLLLVPEAQAASGPWVLSPRDGSVFIGTEYQRFGTLATENGSFADDTVPVDSGITTMGVQGYVSYGILPRVQVSLGVPWFIVQANRTDGPVCTSFGLDACKTTKGIGLVDLRLQGLVLDEFYGAPVSLALGSEFRQGEHTSAKRARITNLGEGTSDIGGYAAVGRTGGFLKEGNWSGYFELSGLYRFPNTEVDERPVPGSEFTGTVEVLFGLNRAVTVGGVVGSFWRPEGVDVSGVDLTDTDRFSSLRVFNTRGGIKVLLRSSENVVFTADVLGTIYAENNPADAITLDAGVSVYIPAPRREKD